MFLFSFYKEKKMYAVENNSQQGRHPKLKPNMFAALRLRLRIIFHVHVHIFNSSWRPSAYKHRPPRRTTLGEQLLVRARARNAGTI